MGASISFDSKYRLILDTEVECVSVTPPGTKAEREKKRESESEESDNSGSDGEESGSDSDSENKIYTVKPTPEIISYIRSYLRKNEFLDEFDLITEIDLDSYDHAPGSALVFNSDSIVYMTNNQTIEAVGEWEYLPPEKEEQHKSSKSKSKSKKRVNESDDDDDDSDDSDVFHAKNKSIPPSITKKRNTRHQLKEEVGPSFELVEETYEYSDD